MKIKKIIENHPYRFLWLMLIGGFALYYPSTSGKFLINFDDDTLILNSPEILSFTWDNLVYIFSHTKDGLYHPLTSLSWQIEHALFGLDPFYFHLDNVLLHLLCVGLFYQLLMAWFSKPSLALLGSLLFLIHPMHVENIAWISARKDLVVAVFFLLSLYFHARYLVDSSSKKRLAFVLFFILALFSKASAMVLPALFFIVDWKMGNRNWKQMIQRYAPLLLFSALALALTVYAQKSAGFIAAENSSFSLINRFFMLCYSFSYYLIRFFLPFELAPKNLYPEASVALPWYYYTSALLPLALAGAAWKLKNKGHFIFGIAFLIISIAPLLKIIPTGNDIVSNRYAYMAYFGLYASFSFWVIGLKSKYKSGLFGLLVLAFAGQSFQYQKTYADSLSVWTKVIEESPNNSWERAMAINERAQVYLKAGNQQQAFAEVNLALKIEPTLYRALMNRANIYEINNQLPQALADLNKAIENEIQAIEALRIRSVIHGKMNRADLAIQDLDRALEMAPERADLYNNRGIAHSMAGNSQQAESDFNRALALNPYFYESLLNRANHYVVVQNYELAEPDLLKLLDHNPEQLNASYLLAKIRLSQGASSEAIELLKPYTRNEIMAGQIAERLAADGYYQESLSYFSIALGSEQIRDKTLYQRASAYREMGQYQDAIDDLMAILENMPNPQFFYEIGSLYQQIGNMDRACEFWSEGAQREHPGAIQNLEKFCAKN